MTRAPLQKKRTVSIDFAHDPCKVITYPMKVPALIEQNSAWCEESEEAFAGIISLETFRKLREKNSWF